MSEIGAMRLVATSAALALLPRDTAMTAVVSVLAAPFLS